MEVSDEDFLLQRPDVSVQEVKPVVVEAYLSHVNVSGRNGLIASLQPRILMHWRKLML